MRFALLGLFSIGLVVPSAALLGCTGADAGPTSSSIVPPGKGGPQAAIKFEQAETIALAPGDTRALTVVTSPPDRYEVRFVLVGDSLDAALDRTMLVTGENGKATVTLRAPSKASTFRVRATIKDGPSAEVAVSVSDEGFGTLRVMPAYTGHRETPVWTASAVAHTTCAELTSIGVLPGEAEGALEATASQEALPIELENAPVGPSLAVAIRAGHYAWGCVDETHLSAGEALVVKVPVVDEPMDLSKTDLVLTFQYEPEPVGHATLLADAAKLLAETFMPGPSEAEVLVEAMALELPPPDAEAFYDAASTSGWADLVAQHLSDKNLVLANQCLEWATPAGYGSELLGELHAVGDLPGHAELILTDLAGVSATAAGVPASHLVSWTADPHDTVALGGTVYWLPTRWLGAVASKAAKAEVPNAAGLPEALASKLGCDELGATLGGYASCDATCLGTLCRKALATRWKIAVDASAATGAFGEIDLSASGQAKVDDVAAPISFDGQWVGKVIVGDTSVDVAGAASGATPEPAAPPQ